MTPEEWNNPSELEDEAVLAFDKEAKRYWLLVGKRGLVSLQVSGATTRIRSARSPR
jgi:hypothetical protein